MMKIKLIKSDAQRKAWLTFAKKEAGKEPGQGPLIVPGDLRNRLNNLQADFSVRHEQRIALAITRKRLVAERNLLLAELQTYTRHAWRSLRDMAQRGELPAEVLGQYAYPFKGLAPTRIRTWLQAAQELIAANTAGVAEGLSPFPAPTPEQVLAKLDETEAADEAVKSAKIALHESVVEMKTLRVQVRELHTSLARYIRYKLTGLPNLVIRERMRLFGYDFVSDGTVGAGGSSTGQDNDGGETTTPTGDQTGDGTTEGSGDTTGDTTGDSSDEIGGTDQPTNATGQTQSTSVT